MRSAISKFAATAYVLAIFSLPATVLADRNHDKDKHERDRKHWATVPEPGTLELTLAGIGVVGVGLLVANARHRRSVTL